MLSFDSAVVDVLNEMNPREWVRRRKLTCALARDQRYIRHQLDAVSRNRNIAMYSRALTTSLTVSARLKI